jgi:hypothetical protein
MLLHSIHLLLAVKVLIFSTKIRKKCVIVIKILDIYQIIETENY